VVDVVVPAPVAHLTCDQHTSWLLFTLLARSPGIVGQVRVTCPADVPLAPRITPRPPRSARHPTLLATLLEATRLAGDGAVPVVVAGHDDVGQDIDGQAEMGRGAESARAGARHSGYGDGPAIRLIVGPPAPSGDHPRTATVGPAPARPHRPDAGQSWHVDGAGWRARLSRHPAEHGRAHTSRLPYGPYAAACLAAGLVYCMVRVADWTPQPVELDLWSLTTSGAPDPGPTPLAGRTPDQPPTLRGQGPLTPPAVRVEHVLAGVGAVGTALLQTLWATAEVTGTVHAVDDDPDGVDGTNLNRCILFIVDDRGRPKAHVA